MLTKKLMTAGAAVMVAAGLLVAGITTVNAQYPPTSAASVTVAAGNPNTTVGGSTSIATVVEDSTGSTVEGVTCAFTVVSQPGTGATVNPASDVTDENGVANTTLTVGSTAGSIVVESDCGDVSGQTTVVAGSAAVPPAPAAAPQVPAAGEAPESGASRLPTTGTGVADSNGLTALTLVLLGAMALCGAGAIYAGRRG
jgi:hypothetical protein